MLVVAGLCRLDGGRTLIDSILVDGKLDRHGIYVEPLKRKIVYLYQSHALFPHYESES